jgi:beta-lactamase regulating signal transducer with metallopeptidase domain
MANIVSYSLQIAVLLGAGGLALRLLKLQTPAWRLLCWQLLLAACLVLPLLQSWQPAVGDVSIEMTSGVPVAASPGTHGGVKIPWIEGAAVVLAAGAALRLGMFLLGFARLRAYRRRSQAHPEIESAYGDRIGIRAEIRTSEEVPGPVTFGMWRPVILLPSRWIDNEAVLYHELLHVRRHDWLYMAVEELIRAVLWFHPLVWWAIAQIQLSREEVVDREVIELTRSREQYLETLLAIAAARSGLDLAPAPLFLRKRHLRSRVASLMKEIKMSKIRLQFSLAGFAALALAAGWLAVRSFPLQAAQSQEGAKQHPVTLEVRVQDKGIVLVSIDVDKDGKILNATAVKGPEELRPEALDAVNRWSYEWLPSGALQVKAGQADTDGIIIRVANASGKRIRIGGNVQAANIVKKVTPVYPQEAKAAGIQGVVHLSVTISAVGRVEDVQILDGDPVAVITTVDVNFTLLQ